MDILSILSNKKFIAFGYGQAFQIVKRIVDFNCNIVVDNDPSKWGKKKDCYVVGFKHLSLLNLESYKMLIFPFNNYDILTKLINMGVSKLSILTLQDMLKDPKFKVLYNENKLSVSTFPIDPIDAEVNRYIRIVRAQSVSKKHHDYHLLLGQWIESNESLFYRQVDLRYVFAVNICTLLEYVYLLDREVTFDYPSTIESYTIYGDGQILVPMLTRNRPDQLNRMKAIISSITSNVTIITFSDLEIGLDLYPCKTFDFYFDFNRVEVFWSQKVIEQIEITYFALTHAEKEWVSFLTNYYIQLIDFYLDDINFSPEIMLSIFPHFQQDNIIYQIGKLRNAIDIVYQHGDYSVDTSKDGLVPCKYSLLLRSDYYLVWNDKAKEQLVNYHKKNSEKIIVLGNPLQISSSLKYKSKSPSRKFLVVCPGKVAKHEQKIRELINEAELIARKFGILYDIRFHPLNIIYFNNKLDFFNKVVNVNNCNFEEYDFFIGAESTLLDEIRDVGFLVFVRLFGEPSRQIKPFEYTSVENLLNLIYSSLNESDIPITKSNLVSTDEIRKRHADFILNKLQEKLYSN